MFLALSGELSGFRTLVVVKRVLPHLASNPQFIRMFLDEARIAASLDHPNIVRILEVGQDGDEYFLAMEVVQGRSLSVLLRRSVQRDKLLTHAQSAFIIAQAANGLSHAHNLVDTDGRPVNVVHRDVSPQNILVSFDGGVKVIDFGVARALGRSTETEPGGLKGKIHYMSPEHVAGRQVDRRSDVFSLGVVLWEALCGRRLFRRDSEINALRAIVEEPVLAPSKIVRISPRLERIVMRALEKDPADRFQSAEEMALALERHAFASAGFSPVQIAGMMRDLFASDFLRWKRTVIMATSIEGSPEHWSNTSGTFIRMHDPDLHTQGATVALHGGAGSRSGPLGRRRGDHSSSSRSAPSAELSLPDAPRPTHRRWISWALGGVAVAGMMMALGAFGFSPPAMTVTVVRPAVSGPMPVPIEVLSPTRPTASKVIRVEHSSPTIAPSQGGGGAVSTSSVGVGASSASETASPVAPPVFTAAAERPRVPEASSSDTWAAQFGSPPAKATPKRSEARERNRASCSIILGTQPWSEVWIDGRSTGAHTPYSSAIPCGTHRVTFKRKDLNLQTSISVTLDAGETFKRILTLESD